MIDRGGGSYLSFFQKKSSYALPDSLREELQIPIGEIYKEVKDTLPLFTQTKLLISVGDIVSTSLLEAGITPNIAIVDFRTRREALDEKTITKHYSHVDKTLSNPHGTINPEIANVILATSRINQTTILKVDGEEDLLTLPVILLAPLGTVVIYGQYEVGMIVVEVTEEIKKVIKDLLSQFN